MSGIFGGGSGGGGKRADRATAEATREQMAMLRELWEEVTPLRQRTIADILSGLAELPEFPYAKEEDILSKELTGVEATFGGAGESITSALAARGLGRSGALGGALSTMEIEKAQAKRGAARTARAEALASRITSIGLGEQARSGRVAEALQASQLGMGAPVGMGGLAQAGIMASGQRYGAQMGFMGDIGTALAQIIPWGKIGGTVAGGASSIWSALAGLFSDDRLKKDIKDLDFTAWKLPTIDRLLKLRPIQYAWRRSNKADIGFSAQEVKELFPELVKHKEGYLILDYKMLSVLLLKALRDK